MGRALWIPEALSRAGLEVDYVAGWEERGNENNGGSVHFNPRGHINHHTAGGINGAQPSLGICTRGRSDLAGPLCNVFLPREESRRVIVVASGKANHAGAGNWGGLTSNYALTGVEVEHVGTAAEGLSALRLDNMVRIAAAMCWGGKFGANMVAQHREYALPKGRKPDFTSAHIPDVDGFRNAVQNVLNEMNGGVITAPPAPSPVTPRPAPVVVLRRGAKGNAVRHVQERLNAHSVNDKRLNVGTPDGDFGPKTETAVRNFQQDVRLTQDGVVGPQTLAALDTVPNQPAAPVNPNAGRPTIKRGSKGEHVKHLQNRLLAMGHRGGLQADGDFGGITDTAVKNHQRSHGLTPDGVVGPRTWATIG